MSHEYLSVLNRLGMKVLWVLLVKIALITLWFPGHGVCEYRWEMWEEHVQEGCLPPARFSVRAGPAEPWWHSPGHNTSKRHNLATKEKHMKYPVSQQTQNMCITFVQCWTNVEDDGPTLYKCYTHVLCLLGWACSQILGVKVNLKTLVNFQ